MQANRLSLTTAHEIWKGIKCGDERALKLLYQMYHQDLFQYGKRMTKDDALVEDALQDCFVSIWKYRQTASVPAVVKPYVVKVFRNELLRLLRQRSVTVYTGESPDFSFEIAFDQKIIEGEDSIKLSAEINKALQQLTNRQRELIYYRFYENLSFEEIANLMNMQTRATYKLAARALAVLRQVMGRREFTLLFALFAWH